MSCENCECDECVESLRTPEERIEILEGAIQGLHVRIKDLECRMRHKKYHKVADIFRASSRGSEKRTGIECTLCGTTRWNEIEEDKEK